MTSLTLTIKRLGHGAGLPLPAARSSLAAGLDLCAAVPADEPLVLAPGERALVPTGFAIAVPPGHEGQVRPRSGLVVKHGISVLNSPGTIDADYRGEVKVPIVNLGSETFAIARAMRIAQLVIAPIVSAVVVEVDVLDETSRGSGGFGSTGISG